ncbi:gluconate 2-dehydrogenase subunit 3 family protein [Fodinibius salsisoli]|uniref:Gluconate 2-dehydrogenase subunit 3 family protein n=1 Tax=Fodinibius salsisoli TaxID=2820877 RepID=A0ABT3PKK6_9BACT|nr:gluconate 2-dehydrogenase subunit 3 family protein [Fodinibius salsisoli]MCW9706471.1 gluconate 2-dehydrogenase subunit 3 family protein [Fodinibius salsisoli]
MDRREAIKQLAFLSGGALSLTTVAGIMGGCSAESGSSGFTPQTLSAAQNKLVTVFSERIIPATDTPGAKAAKVNEFIDHMLTNWNTDQEKEHFLKGLNHVEEFSNSEFGSNFVELSKDDQISLMEQLEQEAIDNPNPVPGSDLKPFFSMMKEFTVVGYYTSEIGASEELKSNLVPGYYDACMPYSEVGRAWS